MNVYGIVTCKRESARAWLDKRKLAYDSSLQKTHDKGASARCARLRLGERLNLRARPGLLPRRRRRASRTKRAHRAERRSDGIKRPVVEAGKTRLSGFDERDAKKLKDV